jgi:hypothetical protein
MVNCNSSILNLTTIFVLAAECVGGEIKHRSWPIQAAPAAVVKTIDFGDFEMVRRPDGKLWSNRHEGPTHMMVQSLSGLAAQAVNEGRLDELVWIDLGIGSYPDWFESTVRRLNLEVRGPVEPWDLVERYRQKGLIEGYVLYRFGHNQPSVNVATVVAGLRRAIMISEGQEEKARAHGLKMIMDVRERDEAWCFEQFRDELNRSYLLAQNPFKPNSRDLAIAHRMMVIFGMDEPAESVYRWLEPLSPVIGWNRGDEGETVAQISRYGHVLMPADWSMNIPLLSAGSHLREDASMFRSVDPREIDWEGESSAVAFLMSDGDNIQWMQNDFVGGPDFWSNRHHGQFPVGWGLPYAELEEMAPAILEKLKSTQPPNSTPCLNLGYYYPDLLGQAYPREKRQELLRMLARRAGHYLTRNGGRVLMFISMNVKSPAAMEAYRVLAAETEGLLGIITLQYAPYDAGAGEIFWFENAEGRPIPVVTTAYTIWANSRPEHSRSANPQEVIEMMRAEAADRNAAGEDYFACGVAHVWSRFKRGRSAGGQGSHGDRAGSRGLSPLAWALEDIGDGMAVVSPEELLWRIMMSRNPEAAQAMIDKLYSKD